MRNELRRGWIVGVIAALATVTGCPSKQASPPKQAQAPALPAAAAAGQNANAAAAATGTQSGQSAGSGAGSTSSAGQAQTTQSQNAAASQRAAEQANRDKQLIDAVETAYHAGLADYQAGHEDSARANFNYAVDLMLKCKCDLRGDPVLSEEFDHVVDAVNTLEMDALAKNGGAPQQQEEAPAEAAGNITTPANPTVAATAEAELKTTVSDLPLVMNDYVASYIDFFENSPKGHGTIVSSLERMGRYKDMIQKVLRDNGLPQDLIYQAFAESGFRPQAVNRRSGAGGMWQFMPYGTYGLEHSAWVDERFDPVKATEAYAHEIRKMYDQLGDWYLAMAAYDWGPGNIQKAVQRTGYADFWELYRRNNLPQETKNYVPVFLAVTLMAKNPKQYGLEDIQPDPPLVMDTVKTNYAVDLRLVSDITGAPVQEIEGLNPSLLRMSTPPDDEYDLNLPAGTGPTFEKDIAEIPVEKRRYWRFAKVQEGETLASLARTWHVSESELAYVNQLTTKSDLDGVDSLIIPQAPSREGVLRTTFYRAHRGDTLVTIADRFGVTVEQLRRWNHIYKGSYVATGRRMYVSEPAHITAYHSRRRRRSSSTKHRTTTRTVHRTTKKKAETTHKK